VRINICAIGRDTVSTLNKITIDLQVGDRILVGKSRKPAEITKIEYFERSGTISLGTTAGKRNALTFCIDNTICDK
jgi:hypothetical protein